MQNAAQLRSAAIARFNEGDFSTASALLHQYLSIVSNDQEMLPLLAESCLSGGLIEEAEKILDFLSKDAVDLFVLLGKARIARARGALDAAGRLARAALRIDPRDRLAWQLIGSVHTFSKNDPLIAKAQRLLADNDTSPELGSTISYALCAAMNDLGKWERAWTYAERGAELDPGSFQADDLDELSAAQARVFDKDFLAVRPERGSKSQAPIFVVGMPRSGTSLIEAILAASGQVTPMGEVGARPRITRQASITHAGTEAAATYFDWTRAWNDEEFEVAANVYLSEITRKAGGTLPSRFVDKLPGNALHLGEIALLFPQATIIRVDRDLLDTCVSCYLGRFARKHDYTTRIDWLAKMALAVTQSMDQMVELIPNPVVSVQYEALVTNPEAEIRRLLMALGLDWNDACLTPGQGGMISLTRSAAQIRQAISARSVGRWRRYRSNIEPLADALGIDLDARNAA